VQVFFWILGDFKLRGWVERGLRHCLKVIFSHFCINFVEEDFLSLCAFRRWECILVHVCEDGWMEDWIGFPFFLSRNKISNRWSVSLSQLVFLLYQYRVDLRQAFLHFVQIDLLSRFSPCKISFNISQP
jgi:hypothetical protein